MGKKRRGERSEPSVGHLGKMNCKDGDVKVASSLRACPMVLELCAEPAMIRSTFGFRSCGAFRFVFLFLFFETEGQNSQRWSSSHQASSG